MSDKAKQIIVLFFGAVLVTGVIVIQVRRARPAAPVTPTPQAALDDAPAAAPPPNISLPGPEVPGSNPDTAPPPLAALNGTRGELPRMESAPVQEVRVEDNAWGRNPFLTPAEIAALNTDLEPIAIVFEEPEPEPLVEELPPALPPYTVAAILDSPNGFTAILDNSRLLRVGDQIGTETVREITSRGVVFESTLGTREILLRPSNQTAERSPGGE